ncbi:MAG: PDZ domain-containing protein [Frankiaceae bacterium]|nr:PDZ domain-containing protein [Frankiaceae bacterium]
MSRRTLTLLLSSVLALGLVLAVAVVRVPYVTLVPGPTFNTIGLYDGKPVITVSGHATYDDTGNLNMTTISVITPVTLWQALHGWFRHDQAVVPRDVIYPPGKSADDVRKQDQADFAESQSSATTAALRYLGVKGQVHVLVEKVRAKTPADGIVKAKDEIVEVDGRPVRDAAGLRALIGTRKPGQPVRLKLLRGGKSLAVTVGTAATTEKDGTVRPIIGVDTTERTDFPVKVTISLADIGGPSAGLMFALGIVDKLEPGSLTDGRFIAGTGTIDDAGVVGPIGGIQQKLIGARKQGATVFLVPADNCSEALSSPPDGLTLVKVASLKAAVSELGKLRSGAATTACTKKAA